MLRRLVLACAACCLFGLLTEQVVGGIFTHRGLVAASGISPRKIGSHEGVGVSSRSKEDAIRHACFWGKRTPKLIQYNYRNGLHYVVIQYY